MHVPGPAELEIKTLGPCRFPSPMSLQPKLFVGERSRVLVSAETEVLELVRHSSEQLSAFEVAGPRSHIFFDPSELTCGIVTCGGLCPGLNNVIRSIVLALAYTHGVSRVLGFRYGYEGLSSKSGHEPLHLTPEVVDRIHEHGGTLLGSSRGPQDVVDMVDTLVRLNVGILFTIGGDGTLRGASAICQEIERRRLLISVIGVPKTIDNDLEWTTRSFGFATAVQAADAVIVGAHTEALGVWNGVGLVKLMGRHSGFIAAHASLANSDVNFCLVPEVVFSLGGPGGFLQALEQRLDAKHHALIVVAEGAGQELLREEGPPKRDASGNIRLKDIGSFLSERITSHFKARGGAVAVRYIDPSYIIRSLPANSLDSEFCMVLAQHAVHAGMSGRTDMLVSFWNDRFVHVPLALVVGRRKRLDPSGHLWQRVVEATFKPATV